MSRPVCSFRAMIRKEEYGIVHAGSLVPDDVKDFYEEYVVRNEDAYVLWKMKEMSPEEWVAMAREEAETQYFGFFVSGKLTGIGRFKEKLTYPLNGMMGFTIRPEKRRMGYGPVMVRLAVMSWEPEHGSEIVTACADVNNIASRKTLLSAGFTETGKKYDWSDNRCAIEYGFRLTTH